MGKVLILTQQSGRTDFNDEMRLFALQGRYLDSLVPATTLYTVSFGIKYVSVVLLTFYAHIFGDLK